MREVDELGVGDLLLGLEVGRLAESGQLIVSFGATHDVPDGRLVRLLGGPGVEDVRHEREVGWRRSGRVKAQRRRLGTNAYACRCRSSSSAHQCGRRGGPRTLHSDPRTPGAFESREQLRRAPTRSSGSRATSRTRSGSSSRLQEASCQLTQPPAVLEPQPRREPRRQFRAAANGPGEQPRRQRNGEERDGSGTDVQAAKERRERAWVQIEAKA